MTKLKIAPPSSLAPSDSLCLSRTSTNIGVGSLKQEASIAPEAQKHLAYHDLKTGETFRS